MRASAGRRSTTLDSQVKGLGVVCYPSGAKSFYHVKFVLGRPHRTHIGDVQDVSLEDARAQATKINADVAAWRLKKYEGKSPFLESRGRTLLDLVNEYLAKQIAGHSKDPKRAKTRIMQMVAFYMPTWLARNAGSITRAEIADLHVAVGEEHGHPAANRLVQTLRAIFNFAEEAELFDGKNPARKIKMYFESKRARYLQPAELPAFFAALRRKCNALKTTKIGGIKFCATRPCQGPCPGEIAPPALLNKWVWEIL
jgi:integrase